MNRFALQCLRTIAVFAVIGLVTGMIWGAGSGLLAFLGLLSLWLCAHLWQIGQLIAWLERPKPSTIPTGLGVWQQVFNTLMLQAKSRKRRKQKITQALQRFYHASEVMPDGVMILNQEGRIEWMNSVAREHFMLQTDDLGGILANLVRQPEFHQFMNGDAASPMHELKLALPTRKGLPRTVVIKRTPFDKHMQLLVSQDITPMEKLNQTRSDFIANVSHELRTPIARMRFALEMQAEAHDAVERERLGEMMQVDIDELENLIDSSLAYSRFEREQPELRLMPVELAPWLEEEVDSMRILGRSLEFSVDCSKLPESLHVDLDLKSMPYALTNLLRNAIENSDRGRIVIDQPEPGVIRISDPGHGMSPEEIISDFPELTIDDIRASLAFAADRERGMIIVPPAA